MKIKNVCECTGLTDRTIRYYIEENLISPEYTQSYNGRRTFEFSSEDVELLKQISVLRTFNFTIEEICAIKNDPHQTPKVILGVRTRTDAALTQAQKDLSTLSKIDADRPYTLQELVAELSKWTPANEQPARVMITSETIPIVRSDVLYCPVCSRHNIPPTETNCPNCSTKFVQKHWICPRCKHNNFYMTTHCQFCKVLFGETNEREYRPVGRGRKWFHFLIYFLLFARGIVCMISGVLEFPISPIEGIFLIGEGAFYFFIRHALAKFRSYGPSLYLWSEGIRVFVRTLNNLGLLSTMKTNLALTIASNDPGMTKSFEELYKLALGIMIALICVSIVVYICECVYFKKRLKWFNQ